MLRRLFRDHDAKRHQAVQNALRPCLPQWHKPLCGGNEVRATIWNNDGSYSVDLSRSYKNGDNEWKNTSGFFQADLLNAVKCAERAEIWISRQLSNQR